jgi:HEAT repeat protein
MKPLIFSRILRRTRVICFGTILVLVVGQSKSWAQGDDALVERIRLALAGDKVHRQEAALVLIPTLGLKGKSAEDAAGLVENYLKRTSDDQGKALGLKAYGKLTIGGVRSAAVVEAQLKNGSDLVREAAAAALVDLCASAADTEVPVFKFKETAEGSALAAGAGAAFASIRNQMEPAVESLSKLLPVCTLALRDPNDRVKASGAEAISRISQGLFIALPDNTFLGDGKIDPYEMGLRWESVSIVFAALNRAALSLKLAMSARSVETRKVGTKAAEAVTQVHASLINQQLFSTSTGGKGKSPEDVLLTSVNELLPALAARLDDESGEVRLVAIEGFEHVGHNARIELRPIAKATTNSNFFVRWVAARTLGKMLPGSNANDAEEIVRALEGSLADSDLDVRDAALTALARGTTTSRPATDAILKVAGSNDDPDLRVHAMDVLEKIKADRVRANSTMIANLSDPDARIRKESAKYLGRSGTVARPALPALRKLLTNFDEDVRKEAAKAILLIEKEL